ncbi:retron St85 family effector protein [Paraclostridium bifermentans]|uniref:retron St85 family effector protein n=1 Tax=Paraclostridium bifermentans TaxID=1490 RepID=UPI00374F8D35
MENYSTYSDSIDRLYFDVYKKINREYIDVFLCGGVSTNKSYIRDRVRLELEKHKIRVLYPEDLFMNIMRTKKSMDLLSLENFLAENSDIICIIPESQGSLVELGAFSNNDKTLDKLFAVINQVYKGEKSFIMAGPIKYIAKNKDKDRIIFYDEKNLEKLIKTLVSKFRKYIKTSTNGELNLNTIVGQYYFIQLILYFTKELSRDRIDEVIRVIYIKEKYDEDTYNMIFSAAMGLLYKNRYIRKNMQDNKILLTDKGNLYVNQVLYSLNIRNKGKLYDWIRYGIMFSEYKTVPL